MIPLLLPKIRGKRLQILCLGAHSDDIEIGCGATILELLSNRRDLDFHWVVFSSGVPRADEARQSAALFLKGTAHQNVSVLNFRNGFFPSESVEIKEHFEGLKNSLSPDLIFTHTRDDLHQDHRVINRLTWNTWRNHFILEYEILKYDGDLGNPNFFVNFDQKTCDRKIKYLTTSFKSQSDKQWFTPDTFQGLMRVRGVHANSPGKFAEAFYSRKLVLAT
jgi:LmbE family N-acetylglucosaminyl deacetylase